MAAVIIGETSPRMICRIRSTISSKKISRCSMVRCRASWGEKLMGMLLGSGRRALQEIAQQGVAVFGEDGFGMELHTFHRELAVAQAHDLFDRAVVVLGPGG
eukprot:850063_1